jgi:hypothetical protein
VALYFMSIGLAPETGCQVGCFGLSKVGKKEFSNMTGRWNAIAHYVWRSTFLGSTF